jgi:hypothetical protein
MESGQISWWFVSCICPDLELELELAKCGVAFTIYYSLLSS